MTREPDRIDGVLEELEDYWKEHPDLRLGQIIVHIAERERIDPFYIEDYHLHQKLKEKK